MIHIYYIDVDHLGTPRKITRPNDNRVVWSWESEAYGNSLPDQNPAGLGNFVFNLRFPGQYYDAETGLHYNMARYYNPRSGGFDQSDPIGLRGGVNTYSYVENNPLRWTDPLGLEAVLPFPTGAIGSGVGSAIGSGLGSTIGIIGGLIYPSPVGEGSDIVPPMQANYPPGFWPGDAGAKEWGKRDGCGAAEGKRRFHKGIKQGDNMSKATDKYGVNPETGDVIDPEGEIIGNLGE